ncbi:MAG: hypothetical protein NUW02_03380 [Candidatus Campbellbacteria bacterium]|nr:hypothetical protein [Candidatus Campbellbacteria bacterium]
MLKTITQSVRSNFLGAGVSLLLVASVVVPSAMLAQQATIEGATVATKSAEVTPPTGGGTHEPSTCVPNPRADLRHPNGDPFIVTGNLPTSVEVKNFSTECTYSIHMATYKVFDEWEPGSNTTFLATQTLYSDNEDSIGPGATITISRSQPTTCQYQSDFFEGPAAPQTNPDFAQLPAYTVFDWEFASYPLPLCGPKLTVTKTVINDNGGTAVVSDFPLFVNTTPVTSGVNNYFHAGTYTVSETNLPGYTAGTWGGDCAANGSVTLSGEQNKTCTITNNDNPVSNPATLTIIKTVINDDGGIKQVADFHLYADSIPFVSGVSQHLQPGTRTVHEDQLPGYTASAWGGDCAANGTVTLAAGQSKTCTIVNNDNPVIPNPAHLRLIKTVINDDGGIKQVSDFKLYVGNVIVISGETNQFAAGAYTVHEDQLPGYTASAWGGNCAANGTVTLVAGQTKTCTITNNDNPIITNPATLTVIKTVINDDGGIKQVADFNLYVDRVFDEEPTVLVISGETNQFAAGAYTVREDQLPGYTASVWGGDCAANGSVTLAAGQNKTCTITNNDNPIISNPAMLRVIKTVINDDGGIKQVSDFNLYVERVNREVPTISTTPTVRVISGETNQFTPANYLVFEDQLPGYTAGAWGGDCAANGTVTLVAGQTKTCTIVNNDNPIIQNGATLTVIKTVINDDGGTKQVSDFNLYVERVNSEIPTVIDAPTVLVISGETNKFAPANYLIFENQLSGYTASVWGGDCAANGSVTLAAGQDKTCTITNNDNAGGGGDDDDDDDDDGGGGGGGGSGHRPKVVLFSTPEVLGSSISLTQVPYTGLGTSLFQILLFIIGLLAISGGVTYVIARRRTNENVFEVVSPTSTHYVQDVAPILEENLPEVDTFSAYDEYTSRVQPIIAEVPVDLPIAPAIPVADVVAQSLAVRMVAQREHAVAQSTVSLARLQDVARSSQALVSEDGMKLVVHSAEGDEKKAIERLLQVVEIAKTRYPREDGWLVLDKGRVREALFISTLSMVPLFVEWMVRAEDKNIFGFLRMLKSQEQPVADFMRKVVAELDNAHRARLEGAEEKTTVNPHIAEVTYHLSNNELEVIIGELLQGVDERYDSAYTSVRLALVRVLDVIKERQFTRIGGAYTFSQNQEA